MAETVSNHWAPLQNPAIEHDTMSIQEKEFTIQEV
jgi:hypothetical protein